MQLLGMSNQHEMAVWQNERIQEAINKQRQREGLWTETVAVADVDFLSQVAERLGIRSRHKKIVQMEDISGLEEASGRYLPFFRRKFTN